MAERTLGWIQNPSSFENLKKVVAVFDNSTNMHKKLVTDLIPRLISDLSLKQKLLNELNKMPLVMDYALLKGQGIKANKSRKDASCSGIIQATIVNQKGREFTDDWTADGFLRWAISIGLLEYNTKSDTVYITELGKCFIRSDSPAKVREVLITCFLSYPPAVRILDLLNRSKSSLTKFELGEQLGGLGEPGFTSIPQNLYVQALKTHTKHANIIRANSEGSSDKYARMICGWLTKVGLVQKTPKFVNVIVGDKEYSTCIDHSYTITLDGIKHLKRTKGQSSLPKVPKIVYWQMLATKVKDRDYIRNRRANIILLINHSPKSIVEIQKHLFTCGITESTSVIKDEIKVIAAMGLYVEKDRHEKYVINDIVTKLEIPANKNIVKTTLLTLKDKIRDNLLNVNHRYLSLIDLAYDSRSYRDFEIQTINLLTSELSFNGVHLGESRKPDGIIYYQNSGIIIDNKAYKDGYSLPIAQADEMIRYVEENKARKESLNPNKWWESFEPNISNFFFLFVSSYFKGQFISNLEHIFNRTGVKGAVINVENLLLLVESIKTKKLSYSDFFSLFNNDEIIITQ